MIEFFYRKADNQCSVLLYSHDKICQKQSSKCSTKKLLQKISKIYWKILSMESLSLIKFQRRACNFRKVECQVILFFIFGIFLEQLFLEHRCTFILQISFSPFPYIRRVVLSFFLVDVQLISRKISLIGFYKIIKNKTKKLYFLSTDISLRFQVAQIYITLVNCFDRI